MYETEYRTRNLHPPIRWAAFTSIALLTARRVVRMTFPNLLPSNAWRPELWRAGLLADAGFELIVLVFLLGIPFSIYYFTLRTRNTTVRDLLIDCGAAASLWLMALLLL